MSSLILKFAILFLRFPSSIDFPKCRREIAASLKDFSNRWCKREYVEPDALGEWKIHIYFITDNHILFYSRNTIFYHKTSFRHLKRGIQDFHMKYVCTTVSQASDSLMELV